jgi:gluconolactonase
MALELTPSFEVLDPRFRRLALPYIHVEKLYTGCRWAEGPAWFAAGRYLVWSDIPNDRMLRWDDTDGSVSVFRQPSMNSNGNTVDVQGRLVTCEHRGRCVSRTEFDGKRTVLADRHDGKRFNSPNDVVIKSDGSIWFTDPSYGIDSDYEGDAARSEIGACRVYRIDPASGRVTVVASDFVQPNGLAFSPDESKLYIVEAGVTPRLIKVYDVVDNGSKLANGRPFITAEAGGTPDGFRLDVDGNLWCGWGMGNEKLAGVKVFDASGKPIGFIALPERCANVCFGGVKRNRLFMAASHSLYALYVNTQGTPGG